MTNVRETMKSYAEACRMAWDLGLPTPPRPHVDLHGARLTFLRLSNLDLSGCDLSYAHLPCADLYYTKLQGANMSHTHMRGAKLFGADLSDVDLSYAYIPCADLSYTKLQGANMSHTNITGSRMVGADLSDVDLTYTVGSEGIPQRPVPGLAARVLEHIITHPETLQRNKAYGTRHTRHSCAGLAVILAGAVGVAAKRRLGTQQAAALLLGGRDHPFAVYDDPITWLHKRVTEEEKGA